ncbi:hypothetical protein B0O99DRAFT_688971 [Bisporella sp. PMI_857]|nr:hypothetical protein B0O99DRAFT_688971 [Bisporella sp. PMI_857]
MSEEQLRFDPTIVNKRYIDIELAGRKERLIIGKRMKRAPSIAGRATTCWKAHCMADPRMPLVIKDSWQYTEREEEGELLRETTDRDAINVARYYHHRTVQVGGTDEIFGAMCGRDWMSQPKRITELDPRGCHETQA